VASKPGKRPTASKVVKQPAKPAGDPSIRWTKAQLIGAAADLDLVLDEALTKPAILDAIAAAHTAKAAASVPRGQRLYNALTTETSPEAVKVLAEESARLADRLDDLDAVLAGRGPIHLMRDALMEELLSTEDERHIFITVRVDNALAEARQQASALRQILVALGVEKATQAAPASGGTPLDEFTSKLAEREASRKARA